MDLRLLALPALIAIPALFLLAATWGANALAGLAARELVARMAARFTPAERARLRELRERYRREGDGR